MPKTLGPPTPKYDTGPKCEGCPFRKTSFGYAPHEGNLKESEVLFLSEHLGPHEVKTGQNLTGPTGKKWFNPLVSKCTPYIRTKQVVANVVRCRPVEWSSNGKPMTLAYSKDHVTAKPSPGQVRECAQRYTDDMLARFQGKKIVALGKVALEYMLGHPAKITDLRGTIFIPGSTIDCSVCSGTGFVPGKVYNCKECRGRGTSKCSECGGVKVHKKSCSWSGEPEILEKHEDGTEWVCYGFPLCCACEGSGKYQKPDKKCKECKGTGRVPSDPGNPHICERLKDGQLLFCTYHPAALNKQPTLWSVVERDFSRIAYLEDELYTETDVRYVENPTVFDTRELMEAQAVSMDIETSGLEPDSGYIKCVAATHRTGEGYAFDTGDPRVRDLLARPKIVGQNFILFDRWWLYKHGLNIPQETDVVDTRFLGKLANPDTPNDLVYLSGEFARPPIRGYWKSKMDYRDRLRRVACTDVDATLRVERGLWEYLGATGQDNVAREYIIPMSKVVWTMRKEGMKINKPLMKSAGEKIKKTILAWREKLPDWGGVGTEDQHKKVQEYLYDTLGLPPQKTREGRITASASALEELIKRLELGHESVRKMPDDKVVASLAFCNLILSLREKNHLYKNFLKYQVNEFDFLNPALNMGGTSRDKHGRSKGAATFRFSCEDPNAQQIPDCNCKGTTWLNTNLPGHARCYGLNPDCAGARHIFVPDGEDWEVMSVDLKQAEVIGFLWYAEQWKILDKVLRGGFDAHEMVGQEANLDRSIAKNTTFAILYGEDPRTTAIRLGKSVEEINSIRERYFQALPGVEEYRTRMVYSAYDSGYVVSPFNIRRYVKVTDPKYPGRAGNQAANSPIQNIPPMVIGYAMIKIHEQLPKPARLWMQVHDEVLAVYPKSMREEVQDCILSNLRSPVAQMPASPIGMGPGLVFNVDVEVGPNWGALRKINEVVSLERSGEDPWNMLKS